MGVGEVVPLAGFLSGELADDAPHVLLDVGVELLGGGHVSYGEFREVESSSDALHGAYENRWLREVLDSLAYRFAFIGFDFSDYHMGFYAKSFEGFGKKLTMLDMLAEHNSFAIAERLANHG